MSDIQICMLCSDRFKDGFIHAADLFEDFKRLAEPVFFRATIEPTADLHGIVAKFREEAAKRWLVVAVFIVGTSIGYVDETVKLVSDGSHFCPLDYMLSKCGYVLPAPAEREE